MGMTSGQLYASQQEREWVERFIAHGGGNTKAGIAAYRRIARTPDPSLISAIPAMADRPQETPSPSPTPLPPAQVIAQEELDFENMGQLLEQQAQVKTPQPDPALQRELGFVTSTMIFAALPHKAVKSGIFKRKDALVTLSIMNDPEIGIPYGRYPRLLLAHICTLAKRTGEQRIFLGESQADFIRQLGINPDGAGKRGQVSLLKNSAIQLFTAAIRWREESESKFNFKNIEVASQGSLIWTPHSTNGDIEKHIWQGYIDLSESFYNQCMQHSFPIDLNVIQSFRSSVAMDIYIWLTYKMNVLNKPLKITWRQLKFQFGSEYSDDYLGIKNFKGKFIAQLKLVLAHYPANVEATTECLELRPSNTHIPKLLIR